MKKTFSMMLTLILVLSMTSGAVAVFAAEQDLIKYEAERSSNVLTGNALIANHTDASGGKAVVNIYQEGDSVTLTDCPAADTITVRYAKGSEGDGVLSLYIDQKHTSDIKFPNTGGWDKYQEMSIKMDVPNHANMMFRLDQGDLSANIDRVDFNMINTVETVPIGATSTATPTASKVMVNGKAVSFDAYTINGNNYLKLRDLANVVSGTDKQFAVGYDNATRAITLTGGKAYTAVGGELSKGDGKAKPAAATASKIYVNNKEMAFTAYNIVGNNYFKLRDVAKVFNIGVTWDGATSTIGIDTTQDYIGEGAPAVVVEKPSVVNEPSTRIEAEDKNNTIVGIARTEPIRDAGGGVALSYFMRTGDSITFNSCPSATSLTFRYANNVDTTGVMLYVDGKKIDTLIFPNTEGYSKYKEITFNADIPKDANVKIKLGTDNTLNIDYIDFRGVCTLARDIVIEEVEELPIYNPSYTLEQPIKTSSIRREAEDSSKVVISGSTMIEVLSSGGIAVTYFEDKGESITFKDCPAATSISIRYATPKTSWSAYLYVNGKKVKNLGFVDSGDYYTTADYKVSVDIPKGANVKIELSTSCTGINLDYIDFITE